MAKPRGERFRDAHNRVAPVLANTTALAAIAVNSQWRVDGALCPLSDLSLWQFDYDSAATASDVVLAPGTGNGRWHVIVPAGGTRPGSPMYNRVIMLGAPGAIVATDTVTIGTDIYEFNAATPPAAGTAGSIWVYQGANSAASRANFINAVNGVVDAPNITYDGAVVETMLASAGTTLGTVDIHSADAIGGSIAPSATATATTEGLTTVTDVWDDTTMYGGSGQGLAQACQMSTITLTANQVTAGFLEVHFDFTPVSVILSNRMRQQDEAYVITGDSIVLTLAGGGAPNNQAADVIDVIAIG